EHAVADREATKELRYLVGAAQSPADALMGRQVGDILAEEADAAGGRHEIAGDGVEQCRLAGAVGAQHRTPLAAGNLHVDARNAAPRLQARAHARPCPGDEVRRRIRTPTAPLRLASFSPFTGSPSAQPT